MRSTQIFEIIYVWNGVLFTKMLHECVCMSLFIIIAQMIVSLIPLFSLILLLWFDLNVMHIQFVFVKISYIIILYFIFVFVSDNGCHMIPKAFSWNFCLRQINETVLVLFDVDTLSFTDAADFFTLMHIDIVWRWWWHISFCYNAEKSFVRTKSFQSHGNSRWRCAFGDIYWLN